MYFAKCWIYNTLCKNLELFIMVTIRVRLCIRTFEDVDNSNLLICTLYSTILSPYSYFWGCRQHKFTDMYFVLYNSVSAFVLFDVYNSNLLISILYSIILSLYSYFWMHTIVLYWYILCTLSFCLWIRTLEDVDNRNLLICTLYSTILSLYSYFGGCRQHKFTDMFFEL